MNTKEIIAEAWAITTKEKKIFRWGFASALLETLFDTKLLIYQGYFLFSYLQGDPIGFFKIEEMLFHTLPTWGFITFIVVLITMFTVEIFLPKMCLGAIIGLAAKSHQKEEVRGGLVLAVYNFFPIFAVKELFVLGKFTIVVTISSLILRYVGGNSSVVLIIILCIFWAVSNVFRLFSNFAEEEIVIRKSGVFRAIGKSFKLIISHLKRVVFLMILLLLISMRIIINALILLVIPLLIIGIGIIMAFFTSNTLSISISITAGTIIVLFASYFFTYMLVFMQTVWTITYLELSKLKDLDIIEVDDHEKSTNSEQENKTANDETPDSKMHDGDNTNKESPHMNGETRTGN